MTLLSKTFPVTCHTQYVQQNGTFVAIPGSKTHGAHFVASAITRGATTVVLQKNDAGVYDQLCSQGLAQGVQYRFVQCARRALAEHAAAAAGNPADKLRIIGVTGTKGKTTTTQLIAHILKAQGYKVATLDTSHSCINSRCEKNVFSTPQSDYLHQFFAQCVRDKITYVVMEVSAYALGLHRMHGIVFEHVVLTSISDHHLSVFDSMPRYLATKKKLFTQCAQTGTAHLLAGPMSKQFADAFPKNVSILHENNAHTAPHGQLNYEIAEDAFDRLTLVMHEGSREYEIVTTQSGRMNATNIALAISVAKACDVEWDTLIRALRGWQGVAGQHQLYTIKRGVRVLVDESCEPHAIDTLLAWVREYTSHLTVVMGCGGDRDTIKRGPMGAAAAAHADVVVLTSDDPRSENPLDIIEQIRAGALSESNRDSRMKVVVEIDRRKAIVAACQKLTPADGVVAILGRGNEPLKIVGQPELPINDVELVKQLC